ncbi:MFS transporter [Nocardia pseudovaccinii]|uniref:MFS transporter n=1 Tax=Nocardia pseudovaccinii TaxID=189540 RepID=UPI003D9185FE
MAPRLWRFHLLFEGARNGWRTSALVAGIVGVIAAAGFVVWELRHPNPMLDIRKFGNRAFAGANLAVLLFFLAAFGSICYVTRHLQFVLGDDALETGVRLLPLAGAVFVGSAITGVLTPRLGLRAMVVAGMMLGILALVVPIRVDAESGYAAFAWPLVLLGLAIGLSVSPATDTIMDAFPEEGIRRCGVPLHRGPSGCCCGPACFRCRVRFLLAVGDLLVAWRLLVAAEIALAALGSGTGDRTFYEGKVAVASFFAKTVPPGLGADWAVISDIDATAMELDDAAL